VNPGRSLIGPACVTAYRVGSQKVIPGLRTYVAVDGGMSDNPRPITYQSVYRALVANRMSAPRRKLSPWPVSTASQGILSLRMPLCLSCTPMMSLPLQATGAYNYSMASNYNRVP
jgi:diaminopimelate decarboxylase